MGLDAEKTLDSDQFSLDFLHASREVAEDHEALAVLMKGVLSVNEADSNFTQLIKAVVRLRFLEIAIMDAMADLPDMGATAAGKLYQDLSKAAVLVGAVENDADGSKLTRYFPHLLTNADLDNARILAECGRGKEGTVKALEMLDEIQTRLGSRKDA
jgi:hypothetical protein